MSQYSIVAFVMAGVVAYLMFHTWLMIWIEDTFNIFPLPIVFGLIFFELLVTGFFLK